MKHLYDEVYRRFPEVHSCLHEGDQELPYVVMGFVADWIEERSSSGLTPELIQRVVEFAKWCEEQPRGETAEDDLLTVLVVAFY
jgi:hypothetical protein